MVWWQRTVLRAIMTVTGALPFRLLHIFRRDGKYRIRGIACQ